MPSRRRTLLALCSLAGLSGCGSRSEGASTARSTSPAAGEPTGTAVTRGTPADATESVTLVNDAREDRYVTLAVERGEETLFVESRTVRGGTSVRFDGVVPTAGTYRIVVDTAAGLDGAFDWQLDAPVDTLRVTVGEAVSFSPVVRCEPDCPGVSLGGTSTGYPDGAFDPRGRRVASTLRLRNTSAAARVVGVRVADGDVLDYRYRMPPSTTLRVPVPQRSGETRVAVTRFDAAGDVVGTRSYRWAMERSPTLEISVGATVRFSCGARSRDLQLQNADDVAHTLSVEIRDAAGDVRFTETFEMAAGASVDATDVVATAGEYQLTATTETSSHTADWSTCPPSGPLSVFVRRDGSVIVVFGPH
jgi:hypothetical protein